MICVVEFVVTMGRVESDAFVKDMKRVCDGSGRTRCLDCPLNGRRKIVTAVMPHGYEVDCATGSKVVYLTSED